MGLRDRGWGAPGWGQHLEHSDEHRQWRKLCPSPGSWQRGMGGGIRLCPCCLCPEEEDGADGSEWAGPGR